MIETRNLSTELRVLQSECIGVFRPPVWKDPDEYIPVIKDSEGILTCISIGALLGLQTLTIHKDQGRYVKFPEDKSLAQMMDEPVLFNEWYKKNVYPARP